MAVIRGAVIAAAGLCVAACAPTPLANVERPSEVASTALIEGRCDALSIDGAGDLSGPCADQMRIDDHVDGGVTVTFTSGPSTVSFSGSGRSAAVPGGPDYLSVDMVVLARPGLPPVVRRGQGSCGRSGGPGPQRVRCSVLGGGTAEFITAGTAPRRSTD